MQTLTKGIILGSIGRYKPGTTELIGSSLHILAVDTAETDEDMSSIFMCTSGLDENFCFHQKVDHLGTILPALGLYWGSWQTIVPSGVCGGDSGSYVFAWDTIPGFAWALRGFPNMSFSGTGNVYITVSVTAWALNWPVSQGSQKWIRYTSSNVNVGYTVHDGVEAIRNDINFDAFHKTIRHIARAIYYATPVVIMKEKPFGKKDLENIFRSIFPQLHLMMRFYSAAEYATQSYEAKFLAQIMDYPQVSDKSLFDEPLRYQGYPVVSSSNYWFNLARQQSFLSACETVPRLSDNSISNILEITNFIYNLVVKRKLEIPSSLSDAWLAYRYQYTTTKLDVMEAISFVNRHLPNDIWRLGYEAKGAYSFDYKGVSIIARCSLTMRQKDLDTIHKIWISLTKYGLAPNFYVIWDMIPFSFIADWFIPVGDALGANAAGNVYTKENFEFEHIVYSLKYSLPGEYGMPYSVYYRWVEDSPPDILGYYWFEKGTVSSKTLCKRVADVLSLLY